MRPDILFGGMDFIEPADLQDKLEIHGPEDRAGLARRMDERLLGQMLTADDVRILQQYIDDYPETFDVYALYDCLALAVSLPGYQWS